MNASGAVLKPDIVPVIRDRIRRLGLTQTQAGALLGMSQPAVSKLLRGRTEGYSLERLLAFAHVLGSDVEIVVKAAPAARQSRMRLRIELGAV